MPNFMFSMQFLYCSNTREAGKISEIGKNQLSWNTKTGVALESDY